MASATPILRSFAPARPPLAPADLDAIAALLKLEDTRQFDDATLAASLRSAHPEVRRRAVLAIGRIADPRGKALLLSARSDKDVDVVATVAFSYGQLKDADAVNWLTTSLSVAASQPAVAFEAARALGKIRSPQARNSLNVYLSTVALPATRTTAPIIGEALLSSGRFTTPDDLAPIVRWIGSDEVNIRWRVSWALFRLRDPVAIPYLMSLARDKSPEVRYWAVRGLAPAVVDKSTLTRAHTSEVLRAAVRDGDRRVRTEAIRALGGYEDDESFAVVLAALASTDTWISFSAAEALARITTRNDVLLPKLTEATAVTRPVPVRITALSPLVTAAPKAALAAAVSLMSSQSLTARSAAAAALRRMGEDGQKALDALLANPETKDLVPAAGGGGRGSRPARAVRTDAEYRSLVDRFIVPDYNGAARPHTIWDTPRGQIEIELYPGDAPFGVEHLIRVVESGQIAGPEFSRVVPNFVAQQASVGQFAPLRDEVSRIGLTRGNLSWASSGLDTGVPGYTLATAPHPHIEGDFTAVGRVVRGLDVIDRLELGDKITAARMKR